MNFQNLQAVLIVIKYCVSLVGILIIISGAFMALSQYLRAVWSHQLLQQKAEINVIRLNLGRVLILGLEFIVAADLIGTITAPDYYEAGLLAIIVIVRTILSYSINREIAMIEKETILPIAPQDINQKM